MTHWLVYLFFMLVTIVLLLAMEIRFSGGASDMEGRFVVACIASVMSLFWPLVLPLALFISFGVAVYQYLGKKLQ